jgi:hypothetical protein
MSSPWAIAVQGRSNKETAAELTMSRDGWAKPQGFPGFGPSALSPTIDGMAHAAESNRR